MPILNNTLGQLLGIFRGADDPVYESSLGKSLEKLSELDRNQLGDPDRAARVIMEVVQAENAPMHLLLGSDALSRARAKIDLMLDEMRAWEARTLGTDFADRR